MHIVLADDQPKVRFALRVLLQRQSGLEIVGEAATADDLLSLLTTGCPELVLLGWELPGLAETGSVRAMRVLCPDVSVIALSGRPEVCRVALTAGADAFVSKADPPECLLAAIQDCKQKRELSYANRGTKVSFPPTKETSSAES
jgi:DNA-binding NarL/FixJ family response regulator